MLTLITAAAIAAQAPAAPRPANPQDQMQQPQIGEQAQHQGMDCCKHCCDDMPATHDGHGADHAKHGAAK